jgi:hypothetical protein
MPGIEDAPPPQHSPPAQATPEAAAPTTVETVGVAEEIASATGAASDLGAAPYIGLILALLTVFGGKKAWSFYSRWLSNRHELAMAALKAREEQTPKACAPYHLEIQALGKSQLDLIGRVQAIESRPGDLLPASFDAGELEKDVEALRRRIRALERLE